MAKASFGQLILECIQNKLFSSCVINFPKTSLHTFVELISEKQQTISQTEVIAHFVVPLFIAICIHLGTGLQYDTSKPP